MNWTVAVFLIVGLLVGWPIALLEARASRMVTAKKLDGKWFGERIIVSYGAKPMIVRRGPFKTKMQALAAWGGHAPR